MADKDLTEKTLEAYGDVFADIVNGLLFQGEQILLEQSLTDAQPFSIYKTDGKLHEQDRDVAKYWMSQNGEMINVRLAFLGIENQTQYDKDMPLRVIGYDGAAYRGEIGQEDRYPVVTLVLYFGDEPWGKNKSIFDVVKIPECFRPFVNDYRINLFEIAHLPEEAVGYFKSDFGVVVDYFIHKKDDPNYRPKDPVKFKYTDELFKLMAAITKDHRFEEVVNERGEKPEKMDKFLDLVEEKGRAEGIAEGKAEGIDENRLESIRNVMEGLKYTAQQAMDLLKIPAMEQEKYEARL